jgi:glycogen debranching enzyme
MRGLPRGGAGAGRTARVSHRARRLWPYVLMAWERWQSLPPEEKERYKRQARRYAERGKKALDERRRRRPPRV